ncbi:MAG: pyridoxamine 5'-phosphate oxidase family protein [Desulfobacteraceae bacterium]
MRRKEKEIKDRAAVETVIQKSLVCRLGLCDHEGTPYIVPVCFGYSGGDLYIHSSPQGKKMELLKEDPRVCVEFEAEAEPLPAEEACGWTMRYRSVIAFGKASIVEDKEERRKALDAIMDHYTRGPHHYAPKGLDKISVIRVRIERMTGKQGGIQD